ncbi:MAG: PAS domain-containing protein [Pseudomonadota bacterium]
MKDKNYLEQELDALIRDDAKTWAFIRSGSLDGVWYWDLTRPDEEWMSAEFWRLFGIDPATKAHKASEWQDIIFPEDLALALENFNRHCADPSHPYDQIVRYRHADGSTVWVRCRGIAIRDAKGQPIRMLGAHNDLTPVKRAEAELREANGLLGTVLDTTGAAILALDRSGQVLIANAAARHILGGVSDSTPFAWPEGIHFLAADTLSPLDAAADPLLRALAGEALRAEVVAMTRTASDGPRYVEISSRQTGGHRALAAVIVLDDVTDREMAREQSDRAVRLEALGQLAGGIAHDFNNILATMQYALQLATNEAIPEKARTLIETGLRSVGRGSDLTARLLSFARRQPGLPTARRVESVISEMRAMAGPAIAERIALTIDVDEPGLWVFCDPVQLETALLNLLFNSRDAILRSGRGSKIEVRVRSVHDAEVAPPGRADDPALRFVEFCVTDDGPGMSDEVKRRAVDPFFTTKDGGTGRGLGLSIVYGFVQQSGGDLRLYSEEGLGTTVRMLLPRGTGEGARETPVEPAAIPLGDGQRVLIVEDEADLLGVMEGMVGSLGYRVLSARNAEEGLACLAEQPVDLLLTDIAMPGGMNGFAFALAARERHPAMPVVYMSGYAGFSRAEMGEATGPLLQKPSGPRELARAIAAMLAEPREP